MVLLRRELGDVLREERQHQGRTLREVSSSAAVSLGYLSEVERGEKEASSELLGSICGALGVPLSGVLREVSHAWPGTESITAPVTLPWRRPPRPDGLGRRLRCLTVPAAMGARFAAVQCVRLSVPLHAPFVTALRRTTTTDTVVVRIHDSDGTTGWGEAPQVWQVTGESLASATACSDADARSRWSWTATSTTGPTWLLGSSAPSPATPAPRPRSTPPSATSSRGGPG